MSDQDDRKPAGNFRRDFLRATAIAAGTAASAGTALAQSPPSTPAAAEPVPGPSVPQEVANRAAATLPQRDFPMTGADIFARACKAEGLAALFCCPGNYEVIHAIAEQGVPAFSGRHEGAMCSAADAFIRVTGEVAAASGTEGPGFTNMIGSLAAANACRTPLLFLASNMALADEDTEAGIQLMYQQPVTEGIRKYGKRIIQANRIHEYAGYAFRALRTGVPGPVHLDFVKEVAQHRFRNPRDVARMVDRARYRTEARPAPAPADVRRAVDLIARSERPILVASTGVFYSRAWDALRLFAEHAQIPVTESGPSRGHFPDSHPLSASAAPGCYASADLVILVGQYCMPNPGEFAFGPDAKYIRIDPDANDIGRNLPIDVGLVSCEKMALEALAEALPRGSRDGWLSEVAAARRKFDEENAELYRAGAGYRDAVHPAVIAKELGDFLYAGNIPREQTAVVSGGFGIARYTRRFLQAHGPGQICNGAYQYGAIGPDVGYTVGVGAAVQLGAGPQSVRKGAPLIAITGDAGFGYTGFEMETLAKYRMPAVVIVYNNNAWGTWLAARDSNVRSPLHVFQENLRYDKVAEGLGAHGEYVRTPDQFRPALERAYRIAEREGIPSVINCQGRKEFWVREQFAPGFLGKVEPGVMAYYH
ncbi:thiamine pyrophosphate-binding protein [Muricoccus radiodurans]|uniref:thiamine pyrophosphate-binding protein n=1 Tax=Muricoccus radiodurans TaxID=2231721 RepID=UPI003CF17E54